jgi:WXXGXW repeat (2 copies)
MFRKALITSILGCSLGLGAWAAEVFVQVRPPRPLVERRVAAPGRGFVWTHGYHRWDGRAYVWVPGVWVRPPRPHAHWVEAHWVHRGRRGWVFVEGHWR